MQRFKKTVEVEVSVLAQDEDQADRLVFEAMSKAKLEPPKRRRRKGKGADAVTEAPESPEVSVVGVRIPAKVKITFDVNQWNMGQSPLIGQQIKAIDPASKRGDETVYHDVMEPDAAQSATV